MMEKLLRRDAPLGAGRVLKFAFTVEYEVPLDDNVLDWTIPESGAGEPVLDDAATLEDVERNLKAGNYDSSERLFKTIRENYPLLQVDHDVALADIDWPGPDAPPRFERDWEAASRERGDEWTAKEWLDEIPPPKRGASEPPPAGQEWGGIKRTLKVDLGDLGG